MMKYPLPLAASSNSSSLPLSLSLSLSAFRFPPFPAGRYDEQAVGEVPFFHFLYFLFFSSSRLSSSCFWREGAWGWGACCCLEQTRREQDRQVGGRKNGRQLCFAQVPSLMDTHTHGNMLLLPYEWKTSLLFGLAKFKSLWYFFWARTRSEMKRGIGIV
ncbi:hypothetical protein B0T19DRAFT_429137 [Cercophora scortea]|uniref:Uncharacterized protein n=1 Tax=Cercophora scortea TaxID=314031 RepID=A0AAE0MB72_9PEZI|nr:hypothetical protein B0T19DRAFT_429137 [Cercophora scortea]